MYKIKNLINNENVKTLDRKGGMRILEYVNDLSVTPDSAVTSYFSNKMNVRKRQVLIEINENEYTVSAGAMQWTLGAIECESDVKGVGDLLSKAVKGAVTKESAVKPKYKGKGILMLEPTYRHILLEDVSEWEGGMVLDDGMFLACDSTVNQEIVARSNISSAVFGNEGLFNLKLVGNGIAALESLVPRNELVEIVLENDVLKVDGNFAVAWSGTLNFTVEKSTKTLIGSGLSGEGLVNVYRGSGKVLLAPINGQAMTQRTVSKAPDNEVKTSTTNNVAGAAISGILGMMNK
jgi:uncharacterized protein (AIM24 family)